MTKLQYWEIVQIKALLFCEMGLATEVLPLKEKICKLPVPPWVQSKCQGETEYAGSEFSRSSSVVLTMTEADLHWREFIVQKPFEGDGSGRVDLPTPSWIHTTATSEVVWLESKSGLHELLKATWEGFCKLDPFVET